MKPFRQILKKIYPVGSIYMSVNNTNPSNLFGGTWVTWGSGRVPVGVNTSDSDFSTVEKTGGSKTANVSHTHTIASHNHGGNTGSHTLTVSEMPSHSHGQNLNNNTGGKTAYTISGGGGSSKSGFYINTSNVVASSSDVQNMTDSTGGGKGHTHTITASGQQTTASAGSTSLSLLQPYITCYMWKRTA